MADFNYIIMGAGAWGTAMAIHLAKCGHRVVLVPRDEAKAEVLRKHNENVFQLWIQRFYYMCWLQTGLHKRLLLQLFHEMQ